MAPIMGRPPARHIGDGPGKTLSRPRAICGRFPLSVGARPVRPSPNWSSGRTKGATPIAQDVTHRRPARSLRPHRSTRDRIVAGGAGGRRARLSRMAGRRPRAQGDGGVPRVRLLVGAVPSVGGMAACLAANNVGRWLGQVTLAVAVTGGGLGLILGPWMVRLGRQL